MRVVLVSALLLGIGMLVGYASPSWARMRPESSDLLRQDTNETGLTLGAVIDMRLWDMAAHPLAPETLSRVSGAAHQPPHRGMQLELLTPGDFGITFHLRW